jgi:hypothetical protein
MCMACTPSSNANNSNTETDANVTNNMDNTAVNLITQHKAFLAALPAPDGVIKTSPALYPSEKQALQARMARYVDGHYSITQSRFFTLSGAMNWPQMRTSFYAKQHKGDRPIKPGGGPAYPAWAPPSPADEPGAYALIDFYSEDNNTPDFLISMARSPLPDGTKLVGYFTLKAVR